MRWLVAVSIVSSVLAAAAMVPLGCVGYLDADAGLADGAASDGTTLGDSPSTSDGGADGPSTTSPCGSPYSCAVLSLKPLLYLRFNETGGRTANDSSGNKQHGTYPLSGAKLGVQGALPGDTAVEIDGQLGITMPAGLDFDGPLESTQFTIEVWIKPNAVDGFRFIIDHETFEGVRAGWNVIINDGAVELEFYDKDTTLAVAYSPQTAIEIGKWHHVVIAYDGPTRRSIIWVNKQEVYNGQHGSDASIPKTGSWTIGKQNCPTGSSCLESVFVGTIDELAIYPTLLDEKTVGEHYAASGR